MILKGVKLKLGVTAVVVLFSSIAFSYPSSSKDLCFVSLMDRYLWSSKTMSLATQKTTSVEKRLELFSNKFTESDFGDSWEESLIPSTFYQGQIYFENSASKAPGMKTSISSCIKNEASERQRSDFSALHKTLLTASCFALAPGDAIRCQNGVAKLYKESRSTECVPQAATNYASVWVKRLGDEKFFDGISRANAELVRQIKSKRFFSKNLYQLLRNGMSSVEGYTPDKAEDSAWDAVMMMANSSHDFMPHARFLAEHMNDDTQTALSNLSRVQNVLDFDEKALTPSPFSFPPEVKGICQTTKPYHFWMAAYQARSLIKAGFSAREAVTAVLTYAKAYHTHTGGTESSGGNPYRTSLAMIFQMPFDHPTVSVLRHDLVLNIIGAAYGAGMLKNKSINISDVMNRVFKERPKVGDLDYETEAIPKASNQLEAYTFWEKMFNPNGIYKIVMLSIK